MECALLLACALPAARSGPPWGPAGLGRVAKAGARRGARGQRGAGGVRRKPRRASSRAVSPFLLQALQLCCLCCASVAAALASDSSGGGGLNVGSYLLPPLEGPFQALAPSFPPKRKKSRKAPATALLPNLAGVRASWKGLLFGGGGWWGCGKDSELIKRISASSCKSHKCESSTFLRSQMACFKKNPYYGEKLGSGRDGCYQKAPSSFPSSFGKACRSYFLVKDENTVSPPLPLPPLASSLFAFLPVCVPDLPLLFCFPCPCVTSSQKLL